MKKTLFLAAAFLILVSATQAQRLVLVEEFTGENCGPCADENPRLSKLMKANSGKALLLRYQSPIPSAGPIHNQYKAGVMDRINYYSCYFAPWGEVDGKEVGTGQYPAYVADIEQASIDAAYAVASPFAIILTTRYNAAKDSVVTTIKITANTAYNATGAGLKLRLVLAESLQFTQAPGDNGERKFEHVVRMMYPDAAGTALPGTWTAGQSRIITTTGTVPAYVNKSNEVFMAAWIQNDATKEVLQAQRGDFSSPAGVSNILSGSLREVSLFPNPATDIAMLSGNLNNPERLKLTVTDALGREVYAVPEKRFGSGLFALSIPTSGLPTGIYHVCISSWQGRVNCRLVVSH